MTSDQTQREAMAMAAAAKTAAAGLMSPAELARALKDVLHPDLHQAITDLDYLYQAGALPGVAAVIAERRRQLQELNWPLSHDDEHTNGLLITLARKRLVDVAIARHEGTTVSETAELAKGGALVAAELDRINRSVKHPSGDVPEKRFRRLNPPGA